MGGSTIPITIQFYSVTSLIKHTSYYFARSKISNKPVTNNPVSSEWLLHMMLSLDYGQITCTVSTSPNVVMNTPLADIFTDCVVHLWGCNEDEQRRLTRYVVAYPTYSDHYVCMYVMYTYVATITII